MANYLPVLIVSVTAGIPDDASFQPLPRGQVDYLSHNWQEEDVWRSWRNMTKQKNEIANGVRLENASWRTWWKQRNNLKTVTPETLNWLKDSDVTWLYGPLHTAVDWAPPPRPDPVPDTVAAPPSDTNALDLSGHGRKLPRLAKKPILKHRSISEMLTSALPASPMYEYDSFDLGSVDEDEEDDDEYDVAEHVPWEGATSPDGSPRPGLLRIKSDTNIMRRFGRTRSSYTRKKSPPPRIIAQSAEAAAAASASTSTSTSLSSTQHDSDDQTARRLSLHPRSASSNGARSGSSDTNSSSKSDGENAVVPPPRKHISFNTFVEQCIAIEKPKGKARASAQNNLKPWPSEGDRSDDGYDEDEEDSPYEGGRSPSDSDSADDVAVDDEDQDSDDMLEMRPTRRSSVSSINLRQSQLLRATSISSDSQPSSSSSRPTLRRTSTSRSTSDKEREHVTIAPIAPTILKTGGNITSTANPASSYRGGVGLFSFGGPYASSGGGGRGPSDEEYDDYYEEAVETTPGVGTGIRRGLVYQPPEGSIYSIVRHGSVGPFDVFNQPMVSSPSCDEEAEGDGFDYFTGPDLGEGFTGKRRYLQPPHQQQQHQGLGSMWRTRGVVREDEEDERREQRERRATLDVVDRREKARTPSPEWTPPSNPRVASIKSEEGYGLQPHLPVQAQHLPSTSASDTLPPPSPTIAIPTPGISPAHQLQHDTLSPPSISPSHGSATHSVLIPVSSQEFVDDTTPVAQRTAFLSPTERSPSRGRDRGRSSPCTSASPSTAHANGYVTSGSATSSPSAPGSRSVSESRSENSQWDSRGRSRTSGSGSGSVSPALFSDPERGERERGRSRSRSFSSGGTGSPLGSVSPSSSRPPPTVPMVYRGVYSSTSAANTLAEKHSGREIRDRRGVRLYRKTSEDYVPRLVQGDRDKEKARDKGDGRGRERGRERVGRVSESLSPPYKPSPPPGRGAVPPGPSALGKEMRQHAAAQAQTPTGGGFSYQAYAVNSFGRPRVDQPILSPPTSPNLSTSTAKAPKVVVEDAELDTDPADPASEDGSGASAETVHDVRAGSGVKGGGRAKEKGIRVVVEDVEDGRTPPARRAPHPERATKPASAASRAAERSSERAPRTAASVKTDPPTRRDKGTETTLKVATDPPPISRSSSTEDEPQSPGSLVGRAADIVSSARRGLLGAIWGS